MIGELCKGAFRSQHKAIHLENIETRVLPAVTVLPFDLDVSRIYGEIRAGLEAGGQMLADADLQIAATAIFHDLEFVTGNLRHFERVPNLKVASVFADSRIRRKGVHLASIRENDAPGCPKLLPKGSGR